MTKRRNFFRTASNSPVDGEDATLISRAHPDAVASTHCSEPALAHKQIFTIAEVAKMTGFSNATITRMFCDEKGVIVIKRPETKLKTI